MHRATTKLLLALVLAQLSALAADWPQFRGPTGDGQAPAADPPVVWSETSNITWKATPPGRGRSSPVILGNRIYLTTAIEKNVVRARIGPDDMQRAEHVTLGCVCLDIASGKILWHTSVFEVQNPAPVHWLNSWATPTPFAEAGRLYCDFGTFGTVCLDAANGGVIWKRQVALDHQVGPGSSIVVCQNLVVLVRDGRDAQFVTALNKNTGDTAWKTDRPPIQAPSGDLKKSFSTPMVITNDNQVQIVVAGPHWFAAYEPATGEEIWRVRHGTGFSLGVVPVFGHGLIYAGTGLFNPKIWAIRPGGQGDVTETHVAWKSPRPSPDISSPVLVGDDIYWVCDEGTLFCSDARTGDVKWQQRLEGRHSASPLYASGRLYFFNNDGKATVFKPGSQFELLAVNSLPGPLMASPAAIGRALFVRTDSALYRIEQR